MGYFDFLSPDLQDQSVADDEETNRQQQYLERNPEPMNPVNPQWQRRKTAADESKTAQKEQNAIRSVHELLKMATAPDPENPGLGADPTLIQVRDALDKGMLKPDQLISDLQQILKRSKHHDPALIRGVTSSLNDLQTSLQERSAQAKQMEATPTAPQTSPDIYAGQAQEARNQASKLKQEAASMGVLGRGEKLIQAKNLDAQAASLEAKVPQQSQPETPSQYQNEQSELDSANQLGGDIDATLKATGRDPKTFRMSFVAVAKKLEEKHGIDTDNLNDQVPFSNALKTVLDLIDPSGNILKQLARDMQAGSQQPEQQKTKTTTGDVQTTDTAKEDLYTQNIRNMQAQRRQLYAQLGQMPELQNWFGVIAFVLLSIATRSPSVAAGVLGIAARQGNLKSQLDLIEKEMHEEANFLRATQKRTDMQRKMAADQALHKQDKSETFQMQLYRDYLNDRNLRSRMMERAKSDPQHAGAYKAMHDSMSTFTHDAGVVHGEIVAQDKIINDYLSTPAMKRDAQNKKIPLVKKFDDLQERRKNLRIEMEKYAGVPSPEPEPVGNE